MVSNSSSHQYVLPRVSNQAVPIGRRSAGCRRDLKMRASFVAMVAAFVLIAGGTAVAAPSQQDIGGTWQGTLGAGRQLIGCRPEQASVVRIGAQ